MSLNIDFRQSGLHRTELLPVFDHAQAWQTRRNSTLEGVTVPISDTERASFPTSPHRAFILNRDPGTIMCDNLETAFTQGLSSIDRVGSLNKARSFLGSTATMIEQLSHSNPDFDVTELDEGTQKLLDILNKTERRYRVHSLVTLGKFVSKKAELAIITKSSPRTIGVARLVGLALDDENWDRRVRPVVIGKDDVMAVVRTTPSDLLARRPHRLMVTPIKPTI